MSLKNLNQLSIGQTAVITDLTDKEIYLKLMDMGCLPGEIIKLKSRAPLGDPLMINVSGYSLALRNSEAETILVRVLE